MATTTLQENSNYDLYLPDGRNLVILSGAPAAVQNIRDATAMRLGENPFNVNEGVDYLGTVFTPVPNFDGFRASLIANVLASPDVLYINNVSISQSGNTLSYEVDVATVYGTQVVTN